MISQLIMSRIKMFGNDDDDVLTADDWDEC